jgi:hypothetical protein
MVPALGGCFSSTLYKPMRCLFGLALATARIFLLLAMKFMLTFLIAIIILPLLFSPSTALSVIILRLTLFCSLLRSFAWQWEKARLKVVCQVLAHNAAGTSQE